MVRNKGRKKGNKEGRKGRKIVRMEEKQEAKGKE